MPATSSTVLPSTRTSFAVELGRAMHDAGVSYRRLAMLSGLAPGTLNEFANGKKTPTTSSIERIAAALKLEPVAFLEWRRRKIVERLSRDDQLVDALYTRLQR